MLYPDEENRRITSAKLTRKYQKQVVLFASIVAICVYVYQYSSEMWLLITSMMVGLAAAIIFITELFRMILVLHSIRWFKLKTLAKEATLPLDIDKIEQFVNERRGA